MSEPSTRRPTASTRQGLVSIPLRQEDQPAPQEDAAPAPEFISIPEWARRIGISNESAYKAARQGEIPGCFSIGRLYRINWPVFVDATAWMRSGPNGER